MVKDVHETKLSGVEKDRPLPDSVRGFVAWPESKDLDRKEKDSKGSARDASNAVSTPVIGSGFGVDVCRYRDGDHKCINPQSRQFEKLCFPDSIIEVQCRDKVED